MYDHGLDEYASWLVSEVHPSLDAATRAAASKPDGADAVAAKLDALNNRYLQLASLLRAALKEYAARNPEDRNIVVSLKNRRWR